MTEATAARASALFADLALLPDGWVQDVRVRLDHAGSIVDVAAGTVPDGATRVKGALLPGIPNLHSHAFQRAMAGEAEARCAGRNFWHWRDVMYRLAARVTPEDLEAIATHLYIEMLLAGYSSVVEFHYLHHDADGAPYADRLEMAHRLISAARTAGIGLTLLPVLYVRQGFANPAPLPEQRRFVTTAADLVAMVAGVHRALAGDPGFRTGLALHSLRAVPPDALREAVAGVKALDATAPIHIHAAEQRAEVEECLAATGRRPVDWLLDETDAGPRWCFIHCTHATEGEIARLAGRGVVTGLCPTTEANLGDGVVALDRLVDAGGRFGVGSDSHVSVDAREELRWLEYGQRLVSERRAVTATETNPHTGEALWRNVVTGGAAAAGRPAGAIAPGHRADFVVVDTDHPSLAGTSPATLLDRLVFSAGTLSPVRDVMAGGRWVVCDRRHEAAERSAEDYLRTVRALLA